MDDLRRREDAAKKHVLHHGELVHDLSEIHLAHTVVYTLPAADRTDVVDHRRIFGQRSRLDLPGDMHAGMCQYSISPALSDIPPTNRRPQPAREW